MEDGMETISCMCIPSKESEKDELLQEIWPDQFDRDTGKYLGSPVKPEQAVALENMLATIREPYRLHG